MAGSCALNRGRDGITFPPFESARESGTESGNRDRNRGRVASNFIRSSVLSPLPRGPPYTVYVPCKGEGEKATRTLPLSEKK